MGRPKVLIADDNRRFAQALSVRLRAHGYEVTCCHDAYMALQKARLERPDLILLDILMPAGDGFSVPERMAKVEELAGIPIIYITGQPPQGVDERAAKLGAFAVLHKPVETMELLATVDAALAARDLDTAA